MTIRKRLFWSNILMIVVPVIMTLHLHGLAGHTERPRIWIRGQRGFLLGRKGGG